MARTIADLEGSETIQQGRVVEAINYRSLDRKAWAKEGFLLVVSFAADLSVGCNKYPKAIRPPVQRFLYPGFGGRRLLTAVRPRRKILLESADWLVLL